MTNGAKAGMGIGIAVAAVLVLLVVTLLIIHFRRASHIKAINRQRAILAGEKNLDGTDKIDKDSTIDLEPLPLPPTRRPGGGGGNRSSSYNRSSTATTVTIEYGPDGQPINNPFKPWASDNNNNNSPRASFSSKRATRMMMLM
ncbi:hypothetical protein DV735_g1758, partial [Chaetothyriales sp. CBS 134920]